MEGISKSATLTGLSNYRQPPANINESHPPMYTAEHLKVSRILGKDRAESRHIPLSQATGETSAQCWGGRWGGGGGVEAGGAGMEEW